MAVRKEDECGEQGSESGRSANRAAQLSAVRSRASASSGACAARDAVWRGLPILLRDTVTERARNVVGAMEGVLISQQSLIFVPGIERRHRLLKQRGCAPVATLA